MKISEEKVWLKYFESVRNVEEVPQMLMYDYVIENNKHKMHNTALNYYGAKLSFKQLFERIDETANAFVKLGVKEGEIVSFVSVAVPECIFAIYALNKIGATANMIDPRMDKENIKRMIIESGSRFTFGLDATFAKVREILHDINQEKVVVLQFARSLPFFTRLFARITGKYPEIFYNEEVVSWEDFINDGKGTIATKAEYVGERVVGIAYTGGTTGFPKGVMLTNDSVNAVAYNFKYAGLVHGENDKFLGIIPVFSTYGFVCGMHMPFCMGCELIPIPRFNPLELGKLMVKFKPNHLISTPAFYEMMMESKELVGHKLEYLITLGSGGDTMNKGLEDKLHAWMKEKGIKYPLAQGYGMSELSAAATFSVNDIHKYGSVGVPSIATVVSIFDPETGEELGYNQHGEVCITGKTIMKGYFNRPEETENVLRLHDDGQYWIHSGDIGYMDEDGFLFIVGRYKRMITRFDGHKVFPINIESLISKNSCVYNCSVIAVDDLDHSQGQYPMAIVQLREGAPDPQRSRKIIEEQCQELLEERGRPVAVIIVDEIPLTGALKNDFRALEKKYKNYNYKKNN